MELTVTDGLVRFCKHKIWCSVPETPEEGPDPFRDRLGQYRTEEYGLLAYDDDELADIRSGLDDLKIDYTVEDISPNPAQVGRAQELAGKVSTRSEAMRYIKDAILPDHIALERKIKKLEADVSDLKDRANDQRPEQGG